MNRIIDFKNLIKIGLISLYGYFLMYPIFKLLLKLNANNFREIVNSIQFKSALFNSIYISLLASIISLLLALIFAYCLERSKFKLNSLFSYILILPMLLPSISHSFGLVALFGSNGFITKTFNINIGIYGTKGIIIGSVMYSFPVALIMIKNILETENGSSYEALEIYGVSKVKSFFDITIPYIRRTLLLAFFTVFTMIATDYGVPLMIGAKTITLPVLMYNKTVAMLDYNSGSVISVFLLFPAILAFILDSFLSERSNKQFITYDMFKSDSKIFNFISVTICFIGSIIVLLPIISLIFMLFSKKYPLDMSLTIFHILKSINRGALKYLKNSVLIAFVTSIFGVILSFTSAYFTTRVKGIFTKIIHVFSIISMSVPGIIIGFSYLISFKNSILYGSLIIICIVNIIHFCASPYLMMYNELYKVNSELENVGLVLGVSKISIIFNVIIPKVKNSIIEMFLYFFINSMMTISAVAFLSPPAPKPVSLMINQFEAQLLMESAAFVTILILITNLIVKLFFNFIKILKIKRSIL